MDNIDISIVVPVYGCKNCIEELHARLCMVLTKLNKSFEIILINDKSPDNAWDTIEYLCTKDNRIIEHSKNNSKTFAQINTFFLLLIFY